MATRRRISGPAQSASRISTATEHKPDSTELVKAVIGGDISLAIPPEATLNEVEGTLAVVIDGFKRLSDATEKLKPVIGRILLTISVRKLWRKADKSYKNFTEYLEDVVVERMGFGRTSAFQALRIARAFPSLTVEDYQRFGATRLLLAASVTDEQDPKHREFLETSLTVPVSQFEASISEVREQASAKSSSDVSVLSMRIPNAVKAQWDEALRASEMTGPQLFAAMLAVWIEHGNGDVNEEPAATVEQHDEKARAAAAFRDVLAKVTH